MLSAIKNKKLTHRRTDGQTDRQLAKSKFDLFDTASPEKHVPCQGRRFVLFTCFLKLFCFLLVGLHLLSVQKCTILKWLW